jgi:kynurenine formamidase
MATIPDYDDLPLQDGVRCSWGVWGDHDVFGCFNLLTPERTAAAARLVERGALFSLNWNMALPDPPLFGRARLRHEIRSNPGSRSQDELLHDWNTQASTQWDGFRHARREGSGFYGGVPDAEHGVEHWARRGFAGRAVLADVARWRESVGRPLRQGTPDPIEPEDITATLAAQGVTVEPGDILLVRTGWLPWYLTIDAEQRAAISDFTVLETPGLRACEESARLLWNLHVAAIATDNPAVEVWPIGALIDPAERAAIAADPRREHEMLLHTRLIPMLGLIMGELFDLEALADDCAADGRYTCFFTSAPINLPQGVASPPNALALK